MLKKKLNSIVPFSRTLLRYRGPRPLPCTTDCSSSYISLKQNPISQYSYPLSSSCQIEIEEECFTLPFNFSCSRVFQTPRVNFRPSGQKSNLFCSVSSSVEELQCWNCNSAPPTNTTTPFLVCETCRSVQPVNHSIDYFQILGLEKRYEIGGENLESKYKEWQKKLHPDLVHTKSQKEQEYAAEQSGRVTDAYRTLMSPLSRAVYILKLEGVEVDEEERITDPELLAEIMEIREAVEEAAETQALHQIQAQVHEKLEYWSKSFGNAFKNKKYDEALSSIRRMTYYKRANEEIVKKL